MSRRTGPRGSRRSAHALTLRDGNDEIQAALPALVELIVRTVRWVDPETFHKLPTWYPEAARGQIRYRAGWQEPMVDGSGNVRKERNERARIALLRALGLQGQCPKNWTVCHVWGFDDETFSANSRIVRDRRFYSCVGNMVLLPTTLKALTDASPEVKQMLRVCAFHLYGWACDGAGVPASAAAEATKIRAGLVPRGYPKEWPRPGRRVRPPGTATHSSAIEAAIARRTARIELELRDCTLTHYPRDGVKIVRQYWARTGAAW